MTKRTSPRMMRRTPWICIKTLWNSMFLISKLGVSEFWLQIFWYFELWLFLILKLRVFEFWLQFSFLNYDSISCFSSSGSVLGEHCSLDLNQVTIVMFVYMIEDVSDFRAVVSFSRCDSFQFCENIFVNNKIYLKK